MSNAVYPKAREAFLKALIDLSAVSVKALLVDGADYTYDASHEFLSSVPSGARIATSGALGSKTFANGVFDSADPSVTGVTGDQFEIVILFIDTGVEGTSRLLAFYDTGITGMPATPDGGNFVIQVNASGWFAI
jgi:hypothetical protein